MFRNGIKNEWDFLMIDLIIISNVVQSLISILHQGKLKSHRLLKTLNSRLAALNNRKTTFQLDIIIPHANQHEHQKHLLSGLYNRLY